MDIVDNKSRSRMMANIRSKNTKPELTVRKALYHSGYRYRLDTKIGKIRPDIVLTKKKVAIFVHGCYWHRHAGCRLCYTPKTRIEFWNKKFLENIARDNRVESELQLQGWRIALFWECATRNEAIFKMELARLVRWLDSEDKCFETKLVLLDLK